MELALLRSFLALAGQLHFGRTARLLNVGQPALTKGFGNWNRKSGDNFFVAVAMGHASRMWADCCSTRQGNSCDGQISFLMICGEQREVAACQAAISG